MDRTESDFLLSYTIVIGFSMFNLLQGYELVIVGHSLGAGAASVLSLMLKSEYPNLNCYAFSPPSICRYFTAL